MWGHICENNAFTLRPLGRTPANRHAARLTTCGQHARLKMLTLRLAKYRGEEQIWTRIAAHTISSRTSLDAETPVILQVFQVSWLGWRITMNPRALGGGRRSSQSVRYSP